MSQEIEARCLILEAAFYVCLSELSSLRGERQPRYSKDMIKKADQYLCDVQATAVTRFKTRVAERVAGDDEDYKNSIIELLNTTK